MAQSFLWYDLETGGTDTRRDRIFQFSAMRTDMDLQPVGEPIDWFCAPVGDYLPDPRSCMVTGFSPQSCRRRGEPEYSFARRVQEVLAEPGTCSVGFNTIVFDDEFIRHLLYRNLRDPYAREWANGNARWDILDLMRLCRALRPDGLNWPDDDGGLPVFRLQALAGANDIHFDNPHYALSDVRATLSLAQLVLRQQPKLFRYALGLSDWRKVQAQVKLGSAEAILYISRYFDRGSCYLAPVLPVAADPTISKWIWVVDLTHDPTELLKTKDLGAVLSNLQQAATMGLHVIKMNHSPMVAPLNTLSSGAAQRLAIDSDTCERHRRRLSEDSKLGDRVVAARKQLAANARKEPADPDIALYDGFIPDEDRRRLQQLPIESPQELAQASCKFSDPRLPELLFRYRARNFPDSLDAAEIQRWDEWRYRHLTDPEVAGERTLEWYQECLASLREQLDEGEHQTLLEELEDWGDELLS